VNRFVPRRLTQVRGRAVVAQQQQEHRGAGQPARGQHLDTLDYQAERAPGIATMAAAPAISAV